MATITELQAAREALALTSEQAIDLLGGASKLRPRLAWHIDSTSGRPVSRWVLLEADPAGHD